jgi:hypothetical protein
MATVSVARREARAATAKATVGTVTVDPTAIKKAPIGQKVGPVSGIVAASHDHMMVSVGGTAKDAQRRPDNPTPTARTAMVTTRPATCQSSYGPVCEPFGTTSLVACQPSQIR